MYFWLKVLAHADNESVDPCPASVTQSPVPTWVIVQPSAISELGGGPLGLGQVPVLPVLPPGLAQVSQLIKKF